MLLVLISIIEWLEFYCHPYYQLYCHKNKLLNPISKEQEEYIEFSPRHIR
jgi:hypothetical protein